MSEAEGKKPKLTQIITGPCRLFYVNAFAPRANDQGVEKYSTQVLIKKGDKTTLDLIRTAIKHAKDDYKAKFGAAFPTDGHLPVRDGDVEFEQGDKPDADYKGHYFLNASSKQKPGIVDSEGQEIISQSEIYSGLFARVILNFYPFKVKGNRGIAAGLNGIQKIRDGDPKSGIGSVGEIFGRYESAEPEDDPGF